MSKFVVEETDGRARTGKLECSHGVVRTPVFMPVGTQATVKSLSPEDLVENGVGLILANTYHLYLRPGSKTIEKLGGIQQFMHWDRPVLTDSGGFQVFSLGFGIEHQVGKLIDLFSQDMVLGEAVAIDPKELVKRTKLCKIEEDGPTFQSHQDGTVHFFPPEKSMEVQAEIGADFVVALDECTSPLHDHNYTQISMKRSHRWEKRSLEALVKLRSEGKSKNQECFGVIQGGPFEDLRRESAKFVDTNEFFGIGIGGALVSNETMIKILGWIAEEVDKAKPKHLLGIGTPREIFEAVERGVDMFDSVHPSRIARMGYVLARPEAGIPNYNKDRFFYDISKKEYAEDKRPLSKFCQCYTCKNFTRAYVHHLLRAKELLLYRLITIHNTAFMSTLMREIQEAIAKKRFAKLKASWLEYPQEVS